MFLNNWNNLEEMKSDFWPSYDGHKYAGELEGANVLLASYGTPSYEGYAFVLFERDGKLYEVDGSHCSCYGLEGQWEPEETNVEALLHRLDKGELGASSYDENPFAAELRKVLDALPSNAGVTGSGEGQ
jgi:hypothetical protein